MKILIISSGTPPSAVLLQKEISNCDYIIGVDGGANFLYKNNISPNMLIGDMDSICPEALNFFKNENVAIEQYPKNKDCTDTHLALNKAFSLKATEIVLLGCTGGNRIDHFLGNIGSLAECLNRSIPATIKDDNNIIAFIDKSVTIHGTKGEIFSLHAYSELVTNLNITGAKFNLSDYDLQLGNSLTLSNEFLDRPIKISFDRGKLLLLINKMHNGVNLKS